MAEVTVKQLAGVVGTPVERLLEQLGEAGVGKSSAEDTVNDEEKMKLLEYLRQSHGRTGTTGAGESGDSSQITLRRKRTSELKVGGSGGRKAVNVEVRGKRTYVKRSVATGADQEKREQAEAERLATGARAAHDAGLRVHAGHGLNYRNLPRFQESVPHVEEVSIGFAVIARAVLVGIDQAVRDIRSALHSH